MPDFPIWSERVLVDTWEPMMTLVNDVAYFFSTNIGGVPACLECPSDPIIFRKAPLPFTAGGPEYEAFAENGGQVWNYLDRGDEEPVENADTVVVASPQGTLFATWMRDWNITFSSSSDQGETWSDGVCVSGELMADKNWMTLDPADPRQIFVTFNSVSPYSAVTLDGGVTWGHPIELEHIPNTYSFACGAAFRQSDNTTFYAYAAIPDADDVNTTYNGVYSSKDHFATHNYSIIQYFQLEQPCPEWADCSEPEEYLIGGCGMAIDAGETVYYIANAQSPTSLLMRIMLSSLPAAGSLFTAPVDVSDAPLQADIYHAFPFVATGTQPGDVRVAWMDNRTGAWNLWYRRSTDGGFSWTTSVRLSTAQMFGFQSEEGFLFPYGDYGTMVVDQHDNTHIIWGEGYGHYTGGTVMYAFENPTRASEPMSEQSKLILTGFLSAFLGILVTAIVWFAVTKMRSNSDYEPLGGN